MSVQEVIVWRRRRLVANLAVDPVIVASAAPSVNEPSMPGRIGGKNVASGPANSTTTTVAGTSGTGALTVMAAPPSTVLTGKDVSGAVIKYAFSILLLIGSHSTASFGQSKTWRKSFPCF